MRENKLNHECEVDNGVNADNMDTGGEVGGKNEGGSKYVRELDHKYEAVGNDGELESGNVK